MKLRPHHILCVQFLPEGNIGRGDQFKEMETKIKDVMIRHDDTLIEVAEGVDELCGACPDCADGRCNNRYGDEDSVRKWDARIMNGLEISYHDRVRAMDLRSLIRKKAPLAFCRDRCPWRSVCGVFDQNTGAQG